MQPVRFAFLCVVSFGLPATTGFADDQKVESVSRLDSALLFSNVGEMGSAFLGQAPGGAAAAAPSAPAAPPSSWSLSGYAQIAYTWNFNQPLNGTTSGGSPVGGKNNALKENDLRVFDVNHNEFSLHTVALDASKKATDDSIVGFRVVAMAGQDAKWIHAAGLFDRPETIADGIAPDGGGEDFDLVDAYIEIKVPEKVLPLATTITVGKFETMHGGEVIHPTKNTQYSRSYLFGYSIPFTHMGAKIDMTLVERANDKGEMFGAGFAVVNGWDNVKDNNDAKSWIFQGRLTPCDFFTTAAVLMFGPEQTGDNSNNRGILDLTATVTQKINEDNSISVTGNYDFGWEDGVGAVGYTEWYGFAGYVRYDYKKFFAAIRGEIFVDQDGTRTGLTATNGGGAVAEFTGTLAYRVSEPLLVRAEYRYDKADQPVFEQRGVVETNNMHTVSMDLLFTF